MGKRELAEKIVLAMIQAGLIKLPEISCTKTPVSESSREKMRDRARIVETLINECASALSS